MVRTGQGYWRVKGLTADRDGYKTVTVHADAGASFSEVVELVKMKVRREVSLRTGCDERSVEVSYVEVADEL